MLDSSVYTGDENRAVSVIDKNLPQVSHIFYLSIILNTERIASSKMLVFPSEIDPIE